MSSQNTKYLITYFKGFILLVLILMSKPGYTEISPLKAETMSIKCEGEKLFAMINAVPLNKVMKELSKSTGVEVVWHGRQTTRMVQIRCTNLFPDEVVRRLLRNENYILYYSSVSGKEELEKVVIFPKGGGEEEQVPTIQPARDPRMFAMAEEPELDIPELYDAESAYFENQELFEAIDERLAEGDWEDANALTMELYNLSNHHKEN